MADRDDPDTRRKPAMDASTGRPEALASMNARQIEAAWLLTGNGTARKL